MNQIADTFRSLRTTGAKTLLPYVTGGYPDAQTTVEILQQIDPARCAAVEIGVPFSDPIADGPVIQASFSRALDRGFRLDALLDEIRNNRSTIRPALLAMVSYSIVCRRDPQRFVAAAAGAGINGLIVPDLALEEAEELARIGGDAGCPLVLIAAPTSDARRLRRIVALSEPFIYYQAQAGVTGERRELPADLRTHVEALRQASNKPVCVGFGISTPEHVRSVCAVADGAIVGSAIVRRMTAAIDRGASRAALVRDVVGAIDSLASGLT